MQELYVLTPAGAHNCSGVYAVLTCINNNSL